MKVAAAPVAALAPRLDANQLGVTAPLQQGRGVRGQYVYWITMPMPRAETVTEHGVKTPCDFDREGFIKLGVAVPSWVQVPFCKGN